MNGVPQGTMLVAQTMTNKERGLTYKPKEMIKARELRIGNWVMFVPDNDKKYNNRRPVQVCEIYAVDGVTTVDNGLLLSFGNEPKEAEGIPLTPEVLEKCGFRHNEGWQDTWWFNGTVGVNLHQGKLYYNDLSKTVELKSLHQLQNLYFCLTGEELPYKP